MNLEHKRIKKLGDVVLVQSSVRRPAIKVKAEVYKDKPAKGSFKFGSIAVKTVQVA